MFTQYDTGAQNGWGHTRTPAQEVQYQENQHIQARERELNKALREDPDFVAGLQSLLAAEQPDKSAFDMMFIAGTQHGAYPGPYDIANTPAKVLHYWREMHPPTPVPEKLKAAQARDEARAAKQAAQAAYAAEYAEYMRLCQERNTRHAEARARCNEAILAARAQLTIDTMDPAPIAPIKPL